MRCVCVVLSWFVGVPWCVVLCDVARSVCCVGFGFAVGVASAVELECGMACNCLIGVVVCCGCYLLCDGVCCRVLLLYCAVVRSGVGMLCCLG